MKRKIWILLVITIIALSAGYVVIQKLFPPPSPEPLVLIGLDGADWNIIHPLLAAGKLPHLNKLIQAGSSGVFETVRPTKSPVIWTSIATGKSMIKHGILDWAYIKENDIQVPYTAGERRVKAFWNILSDSGISVGVINWWYTFPAEDVNGYIVSDRFNISVFKYLTETDVTFPAKLKKTLYPHVVSIKDRKYVRITKDEGMEDYLNQSRDMGIILSPEQTSQLESFRIYTLQDKSIENVSLFMLKNVTTDIFVSYFRLIDITSHFARAFLSENAKLRWEDENQKMGGPTPETQAMLYQEMAQIIEPVYTYLDNVVGRIVENARENSTFILVSDHGFNFSARGYNHYDTPVIPHGIVILKGPGIKAGFRLKQSSIYDITPTLLNHFRLPVAEDMDGKVLMDAYEDGFKKKRKIQTIASYEGDTAPKKKKRSKELDEQVLRQLRTLGYIKAP